MTRKRLVRILLTLARHRRVSRLHPLAARTCGRRLHILVDSNLGWFAGAVVVMLAGVPPMAYRWQQLLRREGSASACPG